MAWERWKDVLYPGAYTLADGRRVQYSPQDVARAVENARGLLAKGYPLPLAWDHDAANVPRGAAALAADVAARNRATFGSVKEVRLSPDGYAECLLTGDDDDDLRRLPKVRFVSPQVNEDWTDPDGVLWSGPTLTHVAAAPRPIQYRQRPFQLSADIQTRRPAVVQLAVGGYEGESDMAEEKDTDTGGGDMDTCPPAIIDALRESGMAIPEEAKTVNEVVVAIKASMTTPEEALPEEPVGAEAPPPPVTMSADAVRLSAEVAQLRGQLRRQKYDQAEKDIRGLTLDGNLEPHKRDAWLRELKGAVQMSADGGARADVPVGLLARIEARKDLPKDSIFDASGTRKTAKTEGHEAPTPPDALDDEAQADKDVDAYVARRQGQGQRQRTA